MMYNKDQDRREQRAAYKAGAVTLAGFCVNYI